MSATDSPRPLAEPSTEVLMTAPPTVTLTGDTVPIRNDGADLADAARHVDDSRYRLAARERRRRRRVPWWLLAVAVAVLVGAFTFVAREVRDVGAPARTHA